MLDLGVATIPACGGRGARTKAKGIRRTAMARISVLVAVFMLVGASEAGAFKWKKKHFKGIYSCVGSGVDGETQFVWTAVIEPNGKGVVIAGIQGIEFLTGGAPTWEDIGIYTVGETGFLEMSWALEDTPLLSGQLVHKGRGLLAIVGVSDPQLFFSGQCWKEK